MGGQVGFQSLGPCSNHCIGCLINWHIFMGTTLKSQWLIAFRESLANTEIRNKLRPFIVRGFCIALVEYIATWNTWSKISHYLLGKIKTPFYIRPTTLIWASNDRHNYDEFLFRLWTSTLNTDFSHSAIKSQYCWEILVLYESLYIIIYYSHKRSAIIIMLSWLSWRYCENIDSLGLCLL